MDSMQRRGRLLLVAITTWVVGERLLGLAVTFAGDWDEIRWLRSVIYPLVLIAYTLWQWGGDRTTSRYLGWILILDGGLLLAIFLSVAVPTAFVTPPEQRAIRFWLVLTFVMCGPLLLTGAIRVGIGLVLLRSRAVKEYVRVLADPSRIVYRSESRFSLLFDPLLRPFGLDSKSRLHRRIERHWAERESIRSLTREMLDELPDHRLSSTVVAYVTNRIDGDDANALAIVESLPRGFQALYSTYWVEAEVNNGGFHQYFFNRAEWAFMALEGYKLFGANELAALMARAIELHLAEEQQQDSLRTDDLTQAIEHYVVARQVSALPELDAHYYEICDESLAERYIRSHVDDFVTEGGDGVHPHAGAK